jgi:hypothetical protein
MTTMERLARHLLDLLLEMGYHTASVHVEGSLDSLGRFSGQVYAWLDCDPFGSGLDHSEFLSSAQAAWESVLRENKVEAQPNPPGHP